MVGSPLPDVLVLASGRCIPSRDRHRPASQILSHPGNPLPDWLFAAWLDSWSDHAMLRSHMALAHRLSQVEGVILLLEDIRLLVSELHPMSLP